MSNALAARGLRSVQELAATKPHGTRLRYLAGCKCVPCRAANSRYSCARTEAIKRGEGNALVSAAPARRHLLKLNRRGIGRRLIADAARVPESTLTLIKRGARRQLRRQTAARILAVSTELRGDRTLLPAGPTWRLLDRLLAEGYTKKRLASLLGCKTPALQIKKTFVTAKTARDVEKLYCFLLDRKLPKTRVKPVKQGYLRLENES
jgi:hypothetical protein